MSSAYRKDQEMTIAQGECGTFGAHQICFEGGRETKESNRTLRIADVRVDGSTLLSPALVSYPGSMSPIGSPAVRSTPAHDLYLSLMNIDGDKQTIGLHVYDSPLIMWIWTGAGIAAMGAVISLWPKRARVTEASAPVAPTAFGEATGK
jgi:cytochrome c-type biogenesis protein CcmF